MSIASMSLASQALSLITIIGILSGLFTLRKSMKHFKEALMGWLRTLHPLYQRRMDRLKLVDSIKLPTCPPGQHRLYDFYHSVHHTLDPYLRFDERTKLLTESGWIRLSGNKYYYVIKREHVNKAIDDYLSTAKLDLRDELKVYNCGLSYL